jgi:FAD/FMN-containing dehydrogenase
LEKSEGSAAQMAKWSTWSGNHKAKPSALHFIRSVEDAQAMIAQAARVGRRVRVAGSGHSHAPLVPNPDTIVDLSGLSGVISVDRENLSARVWAGTRICQLGRPLHDAGLALFNQGDIDRQTIAGITATGTHGTGRNLKNLSASVKAMTLILASGEKVRCRAEENASLFEGARLGLGAFGLVTEMEIHLRDAYRLKEKAWQEDFASFFPRIGVLANSHRHFEFFWNPLTDEVFAKTMDETEEPAVYPLGGEGERCAWSYEVFPNHRPQLHTEMEYALPEEKGPECFEAIRALIRSDFPDLQWPVEYRTLAKDEIWLSPAYGRQSVTLSVHQTIDENDKPLFSACEKIFLAFGGRPHWGKVHYLEAADFKAAYPKWGEWWDVRNAHDPTGVFLNDHLASLGGALTPQ